MTQVDFTIVTLSFNQGSFLKQAIDSVRFQNEKSWELIIIDAGSIDGSRELIKEVATRDPRVKFIFEADSGPADGLNKGFEAAQGKIIGYLNSDDYYLKNIFSRVKKAFEENKDCTCIYAHGLILENNLTRFQTSDNFSPRNYALRKGLVIQQSTFFSRERLNRSRVSFNVENRITWDGEFLIDLALDHQKILRVHDVWGVFRIYPESISGSGKYANLAEAEFKRIQKKIIQDTNLTLLEISINKSTRYLHSLKRRFLNILFGQFLKKKWKSRYLND